MSKARDLANAGTALGAVTATELGYVDGVTSAIQTQIDSKIGSASAINPTIVNAKGDLISASADNTPAILTVGNNGDTLVADSATATGLAYIPLNNAGKNLAINGAAQIWQRGTSVTGTTSAFCADRFQAYRNTTGSTFSRQTTSDTTNLPFIQYCIRAQRNNADSATNAIWVSQTLESVNSIPFAGKSITFSFYARKGANFSAASNALTVNVSSGTGTDQNIFSGFTGSTSVINSTATLTATWQRFTFTGTVAATATQLAFYTVYTPVGTAGAADYYEITGMQLEQGSTATTFQTATGTLQGELAACQRYFEKSYDIATALGTAEEDMAIWGTASAGDLTLISGVVQFKVTKRVTPTITIYNTATGATGTFVAGASTMTVASTVRSQNGIGRVYTTANMGSGTYTRLHYTASSEL